MELFHRVLLKAKQPYNVFVAAEVVACAALKNPTYLEICGPCSEIRIGQRNVASLVNAMLHAEFESEESYLKELLQSVVHAETLNLGSWCIECLSILELEGWQFPPSSPKVLTLGVAFGQLDFPGICSFLQSSLDLETLVIEWYDNRERPAVKVKRG